MRFFFRSRQFKVIVAVVAIITALSILVVSSGGATAPHTSIFGTIAAPIQKIASGISETLENLGEKLQNNEQVILQNAKLLEEINRLNEKITDYDELKADNEFYKEFLEIKEIHPDFKFQNADIISRDSVDAFGGCTIDAGSLQGIEKYDPVITSAGLVGYISEVGLSTSKVTTVLDADISIGAIDSRTRDAGVIGGTLDLAKQGNTQMYNIQRSATVAIGDYVVTSGSGVFPSGILIGKITNIGKKEHATSLYGVIEPFAKISEVSRVMVITDFSGKAELK